MRVRKYFGYLNFEEKKEAKVKEKKVKKRKKVKQELVWLKL